MHYRGEPDPFKGDAPNARVRAFAAEVLEVLFNTDTTARPASTSSSLAAQGRIQGFGSEGPSPGRAGGGGGGGGYSGGHYSGAGGGGGGGIGGGIAALSNAAAQLDGPLAAGVATVAGAINDFLGNPSARAGLTGSRYGNGSPRRESGGYGGFEPMGGGGGGGSSGARIGGSSTYAPPVGRSGGGGAGGVFGGGNGGGGEEALVDDITAPGGLRPAPDDADLRRFAEAAGALDGLKLAELLRAKMEGPASSGGPGWQVPLRALCALEALLAHGSGQACGEAAVMFQSEPTPVQVLATHPQAAVRDAAARCLRLLLGDDAVPPPPPAAAAATAAGGGRTGGGAPAADLLSLDDDAGGQAATPSAAAPAASGAAALDLLGDLAGPPAPAAAAAPAPAAAAAPASLFSGLDVAAPSSGSGSGAPAPQPAANGATRAPAPAAVDDLFGGLSLASAPAAPVPVAAAPAAHAPAMGDLLSGLAGPAPTFAQQQQQQQQQQQPVDLGAFPAAAAMMPPVKTGSGAAALVGRALSGGGSTLSPSAANAAAAAKPWSGGLARDLADFDFVQDEFKKR